MKDKLLIYGCYGYTGGLISELAKTQGMEPILSGRDKVLVSGLAGDLKLPWVAFDLTDGLADRAAADRALADVRTVLNCAGPFIHTSAQMIQACLRNKVNYLDITGEIPVFEAAHMQDAAALSAGVMVMPGVGFDVVPTDCMALYLKEQMPGATHLELALMTKGGRPSHGTAITVVGTLGTGSAIRKDGKIVKTMSGFTTREIDFGFTRQLAVEIPWGDVSTAYYTTGIPNIRVYNVLPKPIIRSMKLSNLIGPLLRSAWFRDRAVTKIKEKPPGPDEHERSKAKTYVWGEVKNKAGNTKRALLTLPEGYTLTAHTAVEIARRTLDSSFSHTGFQTPAAVFGSGFIRGFEGVGFDGNVSY